MGTTTIVDMNNISFKDLTTFKTGGNIKYYFEVPSEKDLVEKITFAKKNNLPIFIIGGGSDILVSDKDFDGVVVKYTGKTITEKDGILMAEAGLEWDKVVEYAVNRDLQGIECLSAIPGTVGAAPIQNIGAYGQELKNTFVELVAYDIENEKFVTFLNKDCKFTYRDSIFKTDQYWQKFVIVRITLKLSPHEKPMVKYDSLKKYLTSSVDHTLEEVREAVIKVREEKLENWLNMPNAGSYFKNPIIGFNKKTEIEKIFPDVMIYPFEKYYKIPAGWLIEKTGWKGKSLGPVKVSDKHALILTNPKGKGKTEDILKLADAIKTDVQKMFGIVLETEVQIIDF